MNVVRCGNPECPARPVIDEPPNLSAAERSPCPACGSRSRSIEVTVRDVVGIAHSTLPSLTGKVTGRVSWHGTAIGNAPPVDHRLTLMGLPVTHEVIVRYSDLADEVDPACVIEVLSGDGELLVSGVGATPADALAYVFEQMLPPSSSERDDDGEDDRG